MDTPDDEKYRELELHRGGRYGWRSNSARELERWLDREFHSLIIAFPPVTHGLKDTRRHRQHSWRVHARRVRELVFADPEDPRLTEIPAVWARFIERCRDAARQRRRAIGVPTRDEFPRAA